MPNILTHHGPSLGFNGQKWNNETQLRCIHMKHGRKLILGGHLTKIVKTNFKKNNDID